MALYYCPLCNKKFFIDNINAVEETITCSMCGSSINIKQLAEEYNNQKRQNVTLKETEKISRSDENAYSTNTIPANNNEDISLKIQKKQLEELESIKNMLKFFTILTIISLVISFISAMFIMS